MQEVGGEEQGLIRGYLRCIHHHIHPWLSLIGLGIGLIDRALVKARRIELGTGLGIDNASHTGMPSYPALFLLVLLFRCAIAPL